MSEEPTPMPRPSRRWNPITKEGTLDVARPTYVPPTQELAAGQEQAVSAPPPMRV